MAEHANAQLVRSFFAAHATGDLETLLRVLSPDVVWHHPRGGTVLSDDPDVVGLDQLGEVSARNMEASEGTFRFNVEKVFAGDRYAAVVSHNTAQAKGRALDLRMVLFFKIAGGQIVEVWEAPDDIDAFSAFWSHADAG